MSKNLGSMSVSEIEARIGDKIITQELGGDIFIATLTRVNQDENGNPRSIVVKEGDRANNIVWPTQWYQAVFV